eukprot:1155363-Pelagomonas_calceolata.AAC.1
MRHRLDWLVDHRRGLVAGVCLRVHGRALLVLLWAKDGRCFWLAAEGRAAQAGSCQHVAGPCRHMAGLCRHGPDPCLILAGLCRLVGIGKLVGCSAHA